jgi:excisionase family DNA binding protein
MADQPNISDRVTPNAQIIFADGRRELCYVQMLKDAPQAAETSPKLLSLPALAEALKLPESWIKAEADAGRIPHLKIGKRYRFNRDAVIGALAERAAQSGKGARHAR